MSDEEKQPVSRTSSGLRNILFESIEQVMAGKMDPRAANSVALLADKIIASARLDADVAVALQDLLDDETTPSVIGYSSNE